MASGIVAIKKLESYLQAYMVAPGVKASRRASLHSLYAPHYSDPVLFSLTYIVCTAGLCPDCTKFLFTWLVNFTTVYNGNTVYYRILDIILQLLTEEF